MIRLKFDGAYDITPLLVISGRKYVRNYKEFSHPELGPGVILLPTFHEVIHDEPFEFGYSLEVTAYLDNTGGLPHLFFYFIFSDLRTSKFKILPLNNCYPSLINQTRTINNPISLDEAKSLDVYLVNTKRSIRGHHKPRNGQTFIDTSGIRIGLGNLKPSTEFFSGVVYNILGYYSIDSILYSDDPKHVPHAPCLHRLIECAQTVTLGTSTAYTGNFDFTYGNNGLVKCPVARGYLSYCVTPYYGFSIGSSQIGLASEDFHPYDVGDLTDDWVSNFTINENTPMIDKVFINAMVGNVLDPTENMNGLNVLKLFASVSAEGWLYDMAY